MKKTHSFLVVAADQAVGETAFAVFGVSCEHEATGWRAGLGHISRGPVLVNPPLESAAICPVVNQFPSETCEYSSAQGCCDMTPVRKIL